MNEEKTCKINAVQKQERCYLHFTDKEMRLRGTKKIIYGYTVKNGQN